MKVDISDPVVWKTVKDLDICRQALELIASHCPDGGALSWAGNVAREALRTVRVNNLE